MGRRAQVATWTGLALIGGGFFALWLAWDGAAELDHVQGQFPYLLSGGLTGMGLIIVGSAVLVVQALRRDAARRAAQLDRLASAVIELGALLAPDQAGPALGDYLPQPRGPSDETNGDETVVIVTAGAE